MKKAVLAIVAAVVIILGATLAVPVYSSSNWRTDTASDMIDMYSVVTPNSEASSEFISIAEPSAQDYDAEIARINSSIESISSTITKIDDLGPNTVDVTGGYAEATQLQEEFTVALSNLKASSQQEIDALTQEKENGQSVETAESYSEAVQASSLSYTKLDELVGQL